MRTSPRLREAGRLRGDPHSEEVARCRGVDQVENSAQHPLDIREFHATILATTAVTPMHAQSAFERAHPTAVNHLRLTIRGPMVGFAPDAHATAA